MYIGRPAYYEQLNDISFWLPILERIGMRTPETKIFFTSKKVGNIIDGVETPEFVQLVKDIERARDEFGGEAFLRTGQTSNKHEWSETCHLTKDSNVANHVAALIEFSMLADLPYTTFAVRKMIPTNPITTAFKNMPIAREVRIFAERGQVACMHPYWPDEAFVCQENVTREQLDELQVMPDTTELKQMAQYVSNNFNGAWSIDFLQDTKGDWWLTDMAIAMASYHWPSCENKNKWPDVV